ncbi:hypothetical protein CCP1ISM_60008 [Azospirillaceae bacterium]
MNIQGEEFNDGEIVLIKYKHFNNFIDYVGYFYQTRMFPKILGEFFVDFQKSDNEKRGSVLKFFKIKRVIQIRKLR